jgi:hypothetical protein
MMKRVSNILCLLQRLYPMSASSPADDFPIDGAPFSFLQLVTGARHSLTAHTPPAQAAQLRAQQDLQIDLQSNDDENGSSKQRRLEYEQPQPRRVRAEDGNARGAFSPPPTAVDCCLGCATHTHSNTRTSAPPLPHLPTQRHLRCEEFNRGGKPEEK